MSEDARVLLKAVIDNIPEYILREHRIVYEIAHGALDTTPTYQTFPRFCAEVSKARAFLASHDAASSEERKP